ncbi:MAG: ACT domain-containing protein [Clostridiales bacterium]|nr:ACT domain-containing protein [Clostridiales bacterium]
MIIDQLSVFSENRAGMLAEITGQLAEAAIDIEALTIADTAEFGVLRLIVDAPKKALTVLKGGGFVASLTPVIALKMKNEPGSLATIAKILADAEVSIEYLYACVAREEGSAFVVLRVEDADATVALLTAKGYEGYK